MGSSRMISSSSDEKLSEVKIWAVADIACSGGVSTDMVYCSRIWS